MRTPSYILTLLFVAGSLLVYGQSLQNLDSQDLQNLDNLSNMDKSSPEYVDVTKEKGTNTVGLYGTTDEEKSDWILNNPDQYLLLTGQISDQQQYKTIASGKSKPVFIDTGNPDLDNKRYEDAKNKYMKANNLNMEQTRVSPPTFTKSEIEELYKAHNQQK